MRAPKQVVLRRLAAFRGAVVDRAIAIGESTMLFWLGDRSVFDSRSIQGNDCNRLPRSANFISNRYQGRSPSAMVMALLGKLAISVCLIDLFHLAVDTRPAP